MSARDVPITTTEITASLATGSDEQGGQEGESSRPAGGSALFHHPNGKSASNKAYGDYTHEPNRDALKASFPGAEPKLDPRQLPHVAAQRVGATIEHLKPGSQIDHLVNPGDSWTLAGGGNAAVGVGATVGADLTVTKNADDYTVSHGGSGGVTAGVGFSAGPNLATGVGGSLVAGGHVNYRAKDAEEAKQLVAILTVRNGLNVARNWDILREHETNVQLTGAGALSLAATLAVNPVAELGSLPALGASATIAASVMLDLPKDSQKPQAVTVTASAEAHGSAGAGLLAGCGLKIDVSRTWVLPSRPIHDPGALLQCRKFPEEMPDPSNLTVTVTPTMAAPGKSKHVEAKLTLEGAQAKQLLEHPFDTLKQLFGDEPSPDAPRFHAKIEHVHNQGIAVDHGAAVGPFAVGARFQSMRTNRKQIAVSDAMTVQEVIAAIKANLEDDGPSHELMPKDYQADERDTGHGIGMALAKLSNPSAELSGSKAKMLSDLDRARTEFEAKEDQIAQREAAEQSAAAAAGESEDVRKAREQTNLEARARRQDQFREDMVALLWDPEHGKLRGEAENAIKYGGEQAEHVRRQKTVIDTLVDALVMPSLPPELITVLQSISGAGVSGTHLWSGAHVVLQDNGAHFGQWRALANPDDRKTHYKDQPGASAQYAIAFPPLGSLLFGRVDNVGGGSFTWLEMANVGVASSKGLAKVRDSLCGAVDYAVRKLTGCNIGPLGISEYTEENPLAPIRTKDANAAV